MSEQGRGHGDRSQGHGGRRDGSGRRGGSQQRGDSGHGGQPRGGRPQRGERTSRGERHAPRSIQVSQPRRIAWEVLNDVALKDAYANLILPARISRARMQGPDAAMTTELTYGTLRSQGFYDAVISIAADRDASSIDLPVLNAMRLGAHQLLNTRVAQHAAVKETVGVVKASDVSRAVGFVNAVLRRITERTLEEWEDAVTQGKDELGALAITRSHPQWIVRALRQALAAHGRSPDELVALLDADNTPAAVTLTALPGGVSPDELAAKVGHPSSLSPIGVVMDSGSPGTVTEVREGRARVQDEGSQLVALALAELPVSLSGTGDAWLDMCAGPGGKTAVLAAVAADRGDTITALDVSEHRVRLVEDSTQFFADTVDVHAVDARAFAHDHAGQFARVLVDVPCSGLGALRRRPEARWRRQASDVGALGPVQRDLLAAAFDAAAPGGVVAYTTCSPHLAETLLVVQDFVERTGAAVQVLDAPEVLAQVTGQSAAQFASGEVGDANQSVELTPLGDVQPRSAHASNGAVPQGEPAASRAAQLWPHVHSTDGMFLTLLRKPTQEDTPHEHPHQPQHPVQ